MFSENEAEIATPTHEPDPTPPARRPLVMRVARTARHLQKVSALATRFDGLLSTLLLTRRPAWVDRGIIGLRAAAAVTDALDARVNAEIRKSGREYWPCYEILLASLMPYYVGTYYKDTHWYRVPLPSGLTDVILSAVGRHMLYVNGPDSSYDELTDHVWSSWAPVADLRADPFSVTAGEALQRGLDHPLAAQLDAELRDDVRRSVFLLGKPGTGKSHIAEQTAGLVAARKRGRVLRVSDAATHKAQTIIALVDLLRPDAVVIHDVDTDAFKSAVLLRFAEAMVKFGVTFICTANVQAGMHEAAFGDHRLGKPVIVDTAPVGLLLEVLGVDARARVDNWIDGPDETHATRPAWVWPAIYDLPLMTIAKLRRHLDAGYIVPAALRACDITAPKSASPAVET